MLQAGTLERASISSSRPEDHIYISTAPALTGRCFPLVLPWKPDPNLALSSPCLVLNEFLWTLEQMWVGSTHPPPLSYHLVHCRSPFPTKTGTWGNGGCRRNPNALLDYRAAGQLSTSSSSVLSHPPSANKTCPTTPSHL